MLKDFEYIPEVSCEELVHRRNLVLSLIGEIPARFLDSSTSSPHVVKSFDVNQMLAIYDCVRLKDGYTLDYVYAFDGHGGEPLVYARRLDEIPIYTPEEYYHAFALPRKKMILGDEPNLADSSPYLRHIEFDRTPSGFFQFVLFCVTLRRFYLYWHANYNDRIFIITTNALRDCILSGMGQITGKDASHLMQTNWRPRVKIKDTAAEVVQLCYEKNLGYSFFHSKVEWPNVFVGFEDEVIIPAKIRILY